MVNEPSSRSQKRKTYLAFKKLKDQAEASEFLKERIPSPEGKPYFTPSNYRWCTMPLVAGLEESHKHFQNVMKSLAVVFALIIFALLLGLPLMLGSAWWVVAIKAVVGAVVALVAFGSVDSKRQKEKARFLELCEIALDAHMEMDALDDWVSSRYAIPGNSYLIPDKFAFMDEKDSGGEDEWGDDYDSEDIFYSWEQVEPSQVGLGDELRTHCILVYKNTHVEAPLLPGVQPYSN